MTFIENCNVSNKSVRKIYAQARYTVLAFEDAFESLPKYEKGNHWF